jgi:hypothetical protein
MTSPPAGPTFPLLTFFVLRPSVLFTTFSPFLTIDGVLELALHCSPYPPHLFHVKLQHSLETERELLPALTSQLLQTSSPQTLPLPRPI